MVIFDRHVQSHLEADQRAEHRQRPAHEAEDHRPDQVELLLDAEAPEVRAAENVRIQPEGEVGEKEEVERQSRIARRPQGAGVNLRQRLDVRRREAHGPGKYDPEEKDHQVVERPDAQGAARIEARQRHGAEARSFAEEEQRDEVPREDEEDLHALPAEAGHLVAVEVIEAHPLLRLLGVIDEDRQRRRRAKTVEAGELARWGSGLVRGGMRERREHGVGGRGGESAQTRRGGREGRAGNERVTAARGPRLQDDERWGNSFVRGRSGRITQR